jgi:hypothetical protein
LASTGDTDGGGSTAVPDLTATGGDELLKRCASNGGDDLFGGG